MKGADGGDMFLWEGVGSGWMAGVGRVLHSFNMGVMGCLRWVAILVRRMLYVVLIGRLGI